jgi:uncharacterized membrane protein YfcA
MVPAITAGALVGVRVLPRLPQRLFDRIVMAIAVVAALRLILSWAPVAGFLGGLWR